MSITEKILKESAILEQLWKNDPMFKIEKVLKKKTQPKKRLPKST
jgi:uncharacterized membrane-anchored protein